MPGLDTRHNKRPVYWWNDDIVRSRKKANAVRRRYTRGKRRCRGQCAETIQLREQLATARAELRNKIRKAKNKAWDELVATLDADPWERLYKIIIKKIRENTGAEKMDREALDKI